MKTLYLFQFYGNNRVECKQFQVKEPSQRTAYCYIPDGMTYSGFHNEYGLFPPIEDDLDVISEVGIGQNYAMFSLDADSEKYFEKLRKALAKTQEDLLFKAKMLQLDIDGRYNVYRIS